jgi:hypothetical protein
MTIYSDGTAGIEPVHPLLELALEVQDEVAEVEVPGGPVGRRDPQRLFHLARTVVLEQHRVNAARDGYEA